MTVVAPSEAAKRADYLQILTPDETQADFYESAIKPHLRKGKILGFSHGFSIHFKTIKPPKDVDVVMIAPEGARPFSAPSLRPGRRRARVARDPSGRK